MISRYIQLSKKISYENEEEMYKEINKISYVIDENMYLTINPTIGEYTDTKHWYIVNYWKQI
jgi:hypothetical protein